MKKIASIIISTLYLLVSTGIFINMHYCGGELESISLLSEQKVCCCDGNEIASNCCSNKQLFLQFDAEQKTTASNTLSFEQYKFIKIEKPVIIGFEELEVELQNLFSYDLPPPPKQAIWKINCTFLFYS